MANWSPLCGLRGLGGPALPSTATALPCPAGPQATSPPRFWGQGPAGSCRCDEVGARSPGTRLCTQTALPSADPASVSRGPGALWGAAAAAKPGMEMSLPPTQGSCAGTPRWPPAPLPPLGTCDACSVRLGTAWGRAWAGHGALLLAFLSKAPCRVTFPYHCALVFLRETVASHPFPPSAPSHFGRPLGGAIRSWSVQHVSAWDERDPTCRHQ